MTDIDHVRLTTLLMAAFVICIGIFDGWHGLDVAVSRLFYRDGAFPLGRGAAAEVLRYSIWHASTLLVVAALFLGPLAAGGLRLAGIGARVWGYVVALYVLGPGLLVDRGLKAHWGRARPQDVTEFGGTLTYSSPFLPSDQCASNCSFVSGEVAGATALAVALVLLAGSARPALPRPLYRIIVCTAVALPAVCAVQRIASGRHFLSDAMFAVLLTLTLALALDWLILRGRPRRVDTPG